MVNYKITLDVGEYIVADTLEKALEVAKQKTVTDVIDLSCLEYNDGEIEVTGIYK